MLVTFVFKQRGQHPAPLLSSGCQNDADQNVSQRRHPLVVVNDRPVEQFVVPLGGLNKFTTVVRYPGVAHLAVVHS